MKRFLTLRGLMTRHGDTQAELAKALLLSVSAVAQRFSGKLDWRLAEMYAIMRRYNVPDKELHEVFPPNGIDDSIIIAGVKR